LISTTNVGGGEQDLKKLTSVMNKDCFSNVVVSMTKQGPIAEEIKHNGIPVYSLEMIKGFPDIRGIVRLNRIIDQFNPDIIQCWMYHANLLGSFFKRKRVLGWNILCSDMDFKKYGFVYKDTVLLGRLLSSRLPQFIISNSYAAIKVHEKLGYKPKRWEVIPNGFDTDIFKQDIEARKIIRGEFEIPEDALVICRIARFDPMKDFQTLFSTARLLLEYNPNIYFLVVGRNVGHSNPELMKMISNIPYTSNLHLLGERHDINRILAASDISTSSSYSEGLPNILGESMACGIPCVVTDVGDSKYLVSDTGMVVPKQNPQALFEGIKKLIDAGPEYRAMLGNAARKRITENFSMEKCVKKYESLYMEYAK
jgi:glycosyltransferase involved in cell wall biosynthesis